MIKRKLGTIVLSMVIITASLVTAGTSVEAKSDSKAMSIGEITFGKGTASIEKYSGSATTAFSSPQVTCRVSANYRYLLANGNKALQTKSAEGKQTVSVTFSCDTKYKSYSVEATCSAEKDGQQSNTAKPEVVLD
jgi:hypothetical protein